MAVANDLMGFLLLFVIPCAVGYRNKPESDQDKTASLVLSGSAAECMVNAQLDWDRQICRDFYDPSVGIGFQMLKVSGWEWFATSNNGWRSLWHKYPPTNRLHEQQSVSITHSGKMACPFPGASSWGMLFSIGSSSNFWKYFERCPGGELAAQCTDGYKCGPNRRIPIAAGDSSYDEWLRDKNAVVAETGTRACKVSHASAYNEFSTNGLSSSAMSGVFVPECLQKKGVPDLSHVCLALNRIYPKRGHPWPVYIYSSTHTSSSLRLDRYLEC